MSYLAKFIYYQNRLNESKDVNEKLQQKNIKLRKITLKILKEYGKLICWEDDCHVCEERKIIYNDFKKQIEEL